MDKIVFKTAVTAADFEAGRKLFEEYAASLTFDLSFQHFEEELQQLELQYQKPEGALLLCFLDDAALGCAGIRLLEHSTAELKRLYVKPAFRSLKLGKQLLELSVQTAGNLGYRYLRLDTVPGQEKAQALYRHLGFYQIEPYRHNPMDGTIYMEKALSND